MTKMIVCSIKLKLRPGKIKIFLYIPEFIPAAQALAIVTLLLYIVEFVIMVTVIVLILRNVSFGDYWNPKNISLVSSLITLNILRTILILNKEVKTYYWR
jgi:hypothetical protein